MYLLIFLIWLPYSSECQEKRVAQLKVTAFKTGTKMTMFLSKKTAGHLGIGFGKTMAAGDTVLIEFDENRKPIVRDCTLIGRVRPKCAASVFWKMEAFKAGPSPSFGWTIRLSRDLKVRNGYDINMDNNSIVFAFSDERLMDGHNGNNHEMGNFMLPLR